MADIQPFRGWRYDVAQVGDLSDVTAPPYDVIDAALQESLYKRHPCNVIRLELNRDEPGDPSPDTRYERAAGFLRRWMHEGVLAQDRDENFYVYHQQYDWEGTTYVRRGFLGRLRLEPFGEGKVFPHEQTMSGPKADRLKLISACQMNLSPIFGLYPDPQGAVQEPLEAAVRHAPPHVAVDHLGVIHRLWPVADRGVVQRVRSAMQTLPVFIADGHHRYETALNYRNSFAGGDPDHARNFVLMACVGMSDPGLLVLPTHRLLGGWPALSAAELEAKLAPHFQLETVGPGADAMRECWELIRADGSQGLFGLGTTADGVWQLARVIDASPMAHLAPDQSPAWRELGVSLLHKLAIEHLLQPGVGKPPTIAYVHSLAEVEQAQRSGAVQVACLVPAATIGHVEQIARNFEKMPPKSTYFYPKLHTGLVFHSVE